MKKRYNDIITGTFLLLLVGSCTNESKINGDAPEEKVQVETIGLDLLATNQNTQLRAIGDYAVNGAEDPTHTLTGRNTWLLDVHIYKGNDPYPEGQSIFSYNGTAWIPDADTYFPNYTRQRVTARLEPPLWTDIDTDQGSSAKLLAQDVLIQNGDPGVTLNPAHILTVEMKHAYSMLDFRFTDIIRNEIASVTVEIGTDIYTPYQVRTGTSLEYMLIVPVGTVAPVVVVKTVGGITYRQTTVDAITGTVANHCYCFTLEGFELSLAEITVTEWTRGPGIAGEYTTEQSYPTFRGRAGEIIVLFYDNGQEQDILFNDQGEATVRPVGRTIVAYRTDTSGGVIPLDPPIVLSSMNVDLTSLL